MQEADADNEDAMTGNLFTFHRKFSDIIPISTSIDELVSARFREDLQIQHQALSSANIDEELQEVDDLDTSETLGEIEGVDRPVDLDVSGASEEA